MISNGEGRESLPDELPARPREEAEVARQAAAKGRWPRRRQPRQQPRGRSSSQKAMQRQGQKAKGKQASRRPGG